MDIYSIAKKALSEAVKAKDYALSTPPNPGMGDVSSAIAFQIAKEKKANPKEIADEIAKKIKITGLIKEVKTAGPYINFYLDKDKIANKIIIEALKNKPTIQKKQVINLDIYGPNAMKGLHLGHLRNASLGACLYRILKYDGYTVKTNSFGCDIGLPIAKVVWGYMNLGLTPEGEKGEWLGKIYALAHERFENDPKVKTEIYEINKKIYEHDESITKTYKLLISWSYDYVKKMGDKLRLDIDKYLWESDTEKPAMKAIQILKDKKIATEDDSALIVDLKKYNLGVYVLLTKQGIPTYEAKDIGLSILKKELFNADTYVVFTGAEQVMHFNQLIKTLELMDFKKGSLVHKPYELVLKGGKKLSSRSGGALIISELLNELKNAAMNEITKKNETISTELKNEISEEIAMSSLFYGMIKQDMSKTIDFTIEDWVRFDGDTGAYIQYNYVRANKLVSEQKPKNKTKIIITHDTEYELVKKINEFNDVIKQAVKKLDTATIAHYASALAVAFSRFYEQCPILKEGVNESRLLIVKAYANVLGKTMTLMGMHPLSEM